MISEFKNKKLTWIDLERPEASEVKALMKKYPIHPLVADELLKPTLRPRVDAYKDVIYLILHFPNFKSDQSGCENCEIDFIIGKNFLITAHYQTNSILLELSKLFESGTILGENNLTKNSGRLLYHILKQLYEFSINEVDYMQAKTEKIEKKMFKGYEYELLYDISKIKKDFLDFQRIIMPHQEVLHSIEHLNKNQRAILDKEFPHYLNKITGDYFRLKNIIESNKETIEALRETIDSLLSHKTNAVMKIFTIMAFVTFPPMLLAGIFGMNTSTMPIVGTKGDFWIIVLAMLLGTLGMFILSKRKKWL